MKYFIIPLTFLILFVGCNKSNNDSGDPTTPSEPEKIYILSAVATPTDSESIIIKNNSGSIQNLTGWTLGDKNDPTAYNIPNGTNLNHGGKKTFYRSTLGFQINDSGEILYLKNSSGSTIDTGQISVSIF